MHELRIERSVNTHGLLRVSVNFFPNEMQHTIRKLYSTDRKGLNDLDESDELKIYSTDRKGTYRSNELNLPSADRYSAGVLDMSVRDRTDRVAFCPPHYHRPRFFL